MRGWLAGAVIIILAGCASNAPMVVAPPLAEDWTGWSTPTVEEPPSPPPKPSEPPEARSPREKVYAYEGGEVYAITVPMGSPLDIMLQPGERIHNLVGGDRSPTTDAQDASPPWEVREGLSGAGATARPHVFVAVTKPGLRMGLAITTTERTYYLELRSVGRSPVRSVRWTYPEEAARVAKAPPRVLPDPSQPWRYDTGYDISVVANQPRPVWTPTQVYHDHQGKTYILFPMAKLRTDAPLMRIVTVSGPELVNVRDLGRVYIIDRIFHQAELRLGSGATAELVTITRQAAALVSCPGSADCPPWHTADAGESSAVSHLATAGAWSP